MTRALLRRADVLHSAEADRWRAAWTAFWTRVDRLDPAADAAFDRIMGAASDAELGAMADGTAEVLARATAVRDHWNAALDAEIGPDPDAEAWAAWDDTYHALPRQPDAVDLTVWPRSVPLPACVDRARLESSQAYYRARLAEAHTPAETIAAAGTLRVLAVIEALNE